MRTRLTHRLAFLVLASVSAIGASAGGCMVSTRPLYPDVGTFCAAKAKAMCQISDLCGISSTTCQTYQTQVCNLDAQQSATGTRAFSSDNAKACVDAVSAAFGGSATSVKYAQLVGTGSISDKCSRVFAGNAKLLGVCTSDADCNDTLVCARSTPDSTTTVCSTPHSIPEGMACQDPGDECAPDSYCKLDPTTMVWACSPAVGSGLACSDGLPCVSSQHCVSNTCQPRSQAGGSCVTNDDCTTVPATPGQSPPSYCDTYFGNRCTIGLTFAAGSADCEGIAGMQVVPVGGGTDAGSE